MSAYDEGAEDAGYLVRDWLNQHNHGELWEGIKEELEESLDIDLDDDDD